MIVFNPSIESIPLMPNLREAGPRLRLNQNETKNVSALFYKDLKSSFLHD